MQIATVLRSGGQYHEGHACWLAQQVQRVSPEARVVCLTDFPASAFPPSIEVVPLRHDWPGWWSKMEVLGPSISGPVLYLDLDVVLLGSLKPLWDVRVSTLLRGFVQRDAINSSVMYLRERDRLSAWWTWLSDGPESWMAYARRPGVKGWGGDQVVIGELLGQVCDRWPDGLIISYKRDIVRSLGQSDVEARVVAFHGRPKPWDLKLPWIPHMEGAR